MLKFYKLVQLIIDSKFDFSFPVKKKIIIFDKRGSDVLMILFNKKISIIDTSLKRINLLVFILAFLANFKINKKIYFEKYIELVDPELILNSSDNMILFFELNLKKKSRKFFLQSSLIHRITVNVLSKIKHANCDFILLFGESIKKQLKKKIKGNFYIVGNYRNNFFKKKKFDLKKTITFISEYREPFNNNFTLNTGEKINYDKYYNSEYKLLPKLFNFCKKIGYKLEIIGSSKNLKTRYKEVEFYNSILNSQKWKYRDPKITKFYNRKYTSGHLNLINASHIVYINSTLGYESLSRLKRTVSFSIRGKIKNFNYFFGSPENIKKKGPFWTNSLTDKEFKRLMQNLINANISLWRDYKNNFCNHFIDYDFNNKKIFTLIKKIMHKKI